MGNIAGMTAEPTPLHLPILQALDDLEAQLPELRARYPEPGDRMEAFAALADPILDYAEKLDRGHDHDGCWDVASRRIEAMLESAGWVDANGMVLD